MYTIGVSMGYDFVPEEAAFAAMEEAGIGAVELSLRRDPDVDFAGIAAMCRRHGIRLWSCHLPCTPRDEMDISLPDPAVRREAVRRLTEMIRRSAQIGIDKFVVHPSVPLPDGADRAARLRCAADTLDKLAEIAHAEGAVIAVEDMILSCLGRNIDEMQTLLAANDKLRVCFDVNHLLSDTHADFVRRLGDKIVTVHISDYDGVNEKHWLPGEGVIDFPAVCDLLRGYGYEGVWIYELSLKGAKSADRGRFLTYRDFRRSADIIFSGKNPPKITPDNLYPF